MWVQLGKPLIGLSADAGSLACGTSATGTELRANTTTIADWAQVITCNAYSPAPPGNIRLALRCTGL